MQQASAEASQLVDRAIQQVRTISHLLHPPLLDEVGLVSALRWYLEGLSERSGIEIRLEVDPPDLSRLKPELETAIFRIIQEALTNMFRHSGARNGCDQRDAKTMATSWSRFATTAKESKNRSSNCGRTASELASAACGSA